MCIKSTFCSYTDKKHRDKTSTEPLTGPPPPSLQDTPKSTAAWGRLLLSSGVTYLCTFRYSYLGKIETGAQAPAEKKEFIFRPRPKPLQPEDLIPSRSYLSQICGCLVREGGVVG